ncbi:hypothetical protein [Paludisphaera borealis]|uniref:Uncharacterized protein n=1 Tax=Paludisphaera borealis TaxID=1387353 RepID=A0A1U7CN43_9BACT|nr:hypothetical protein [Paludisphaera borealis]APW60326.1 hypothetical protein BSF38_01794 [Paludisphaera borealis]
MPGATDFQEACRALALGVTMIAAFLGLRQWYERKGRGDLASPEEAGFFRRQDVRRWLGVGVMLALAVEVYIGSWVEPRVGGRGNPRFVVVWLVVLSLIIVMLGLALADWLATRAYAARQRKAIFREQLDELRQEIQRRVAERGGDSPPELPSEDD